MMNLWRTSSILVRYRFQQFANMFPAPKNRIAPTEGRNATLPKVRVGPIVSTLAYMLFIVALVFLCKFFIKQYFPYIVFGSPVLRDGFTLAMLGFWILNIVSPLGQPPQSTQNLNLEWISQFPISPVPYFLGRSIADILSAAYLIPFALPYCLAFGIVQDLPLWRIATLIPLFLLFFYSSTLVKNFLECAAVIFLSPRQLKYLRVVMICFSLGLLLFLNGGLLARSSYYWNAVLEWGWFLRWTPGTLFYDLAFGAGNSFQLLSLIAFCISLSVLALKAIDDLLRHGFSSRGELQGVRGEKKRLWEPHFLLDLIPPLTRRDLLIYVRDPQYTFAVFAGPISFTLMFVLRENIPVFENTRLFQQYALRMCSLLTLTYLLPTLILGYLRTGDNAALLMVYPRSFSKLYFQKEIVYFLSTFLVATGSILILVPPGPIWTLEFFLRFLALLAGLFLTVDLTTSFNFFVYSPKGGERRMIVTPLPLIIPALFLGSYTLAVSLFPPWYLFVAFCLLSSVTLAAHLDVQTFVPYLLDPTERPKSETRFSLASMAVAFYFLAFKILSPLWITGGLHFAPSFSQLIDSLFAGLLTFGILQIYFALRGTRDVPGFHSENWTRGLGPALLGLVLLLACGSFWLGLLQHLAFLWPEDLTYVVSPEPYSKYAVWAFAILLAPWIEEYLFRGLMYRGLRHHFGAGSSALISASLFAMVHPALSFLPVLLLGLITAWIYERSQSLLMSSLLHVLYNASVFFVL